MMSLMQAVARRVEFVAALFDLATLIAEIPDVVDSDDILDAVFELTFTVRSKAEADKVIEAYAPAARPLWRNGVYMAELEPAKLPQAPGWRRMVPSKLLSKLPSDVDGLECDGVIFEMHFVPPIIEQAA
jgi:hypothetical protein